MPRTFLKSRKSTVSSRARAASRQKRSKQALISKKRASAIRKIAKSVVMSNTETKYTNFANVQTAVNVTVAGPSPTILVMPVTNLAALYPPVGDDMHSRDGAKYKLIYLQYHLRLQCTRTHRQQPVEVMIVRCKTRGSLTLGTVSLVDLFPETRIGTGTTAIGKIVGRFEPGVGTVIQKKLVYPPKYLQSESNRFPSSSTNDLADSDYYTEVVFNIPVHKVINTTSDLAEIPAELPLHYCLVYDRDQRNAVASQWTMNEANTRIVFKDL